MRAWFCIASFMVYFGWAPLHTAVPPAVTAAITTAAEAGRIVVADLQAGYSTQYTSDMESFGAATAIALELILLEANDSMVPPGGVLSPQCQVKLLPEWQVVLSQMVELVTQYQFFIVQAALQFGALVNSPTVLLYSVGLSVPILLNVLFCPLRNQVSCPQ